MAAERVILLLILSLTPLRRYEAADDKLVSWSYWEYKTFCRESNETLASDSQQGVWGSCHGFIQAGRRGLDQKGDHVSDQTEERTRTCV